MRRSRALPGNLSSMTFHCRRSVHASSIALFASILATSVSGQQVIPFGDVPATSDFTEAEIAARGQQPVRGVTYSDWSKNCFRGVQGADTKMVCRTTVSGKWDTGQIALRVDLIEREETPAKRLQIFLQPGYFLQPGVKLSVDKATSLNIPYTICLTNGCVAATVADAGLVRALESGQTLSLEGVNANLVSVVSSLPLDSFAKAYQGAPAQIFEQKLEGKWEQPTGETSPK
jgi:invasion protein IalB